MRTYDRTTYHDEHIELVDIFLNFIGGIGTKKCKLFVLILKVGDLVNETEKQISQLTGRTSCEVYRLFHNILKAINVNGKFEFD